MKSVNLITIFVYIVEFVLTNGANVTLHVSDMSADISNGLFTIKFKSGTANSLVIDGKELIGKAKGFYSSINGGTGFSPSKLEVVTNTSSMADIAYISHWGELHYVVRSDVSGLYSYFVITGIGQVAEFRTLYRVDGSIFRNGHSAEKTGTFPTLADIKAGEKLQDDTYKLTNGTVYTKYDYASYVTDDWVHGVYGNGHGVWVITSSHEYFNGGPMKQELMVHVESNTGDGVVLNMLSASHFGNPEVHIPSGKIYGPWLVYFNNGSIDDAESMAEKERGMWPYTWLSNSHYPTSRTVVSGTLTLADGRVASGAMVVLAKPGGELVTQGADYIFWNKADSSGAFSIPHVRPGTYTMYAFSTGGDIGDITDQYEYANVEVSEFSTNVGNLTWSPPQYKNLLWQIGFADRKSAEFKLGGSGGRAYGLFNQVPADLTYTIGTSKAASDWYYAQTKVGTWAVNFTLSQTYSGNAHLTVAMAGMSRTATVHMAVNGYSLNDLPIYDNDASIYRSANSGGRYHLVTLSFPASQLTSGSNTVTFHMSSVNNGGGRFYDTIKLETD